jgi:hypothetical protein
MTDPLAISAVSAVLQFYLQNLYTSVSSTFGGTPSVTVQSPDRVQESFVALAAENQVNLFLHQVTYNQAWRNAGLPSLDADGKTRLTSPPLALDLHYLLTAYGSEDWQAEGLLGYALTMLHENPVLTRNDIAHALSNLTGTNSMIASLKASTLADQVEMIKITPETLGKEELAWLWTALKADYRPTFSFQVSVVLIEPQRPASLALPVIRRRVSAQPIQPAQLLSVQPPNGQPAAAMGDTVTVTGEFLGRVGRAWLTNARYALQFPVAVSSVTNTSFQFVPGSQTTYPGGVPAGVYKLVAQFMDATGTQVVQSTNTLPVVLAPTLPAQAQTAVANPDGSYVVTVDFTPSVWEGQNIALSLSSTTPPVAPATLYSAIGSPAAPFTGNANTSIAFALPAGLPAGPLLARLIVDGVTSQVQVDWTQHPPVFSGPMVTITL